MTKLPRISRILLSALVVVSFLVPQNLVSAQGGSGLAVSPTRTEFTIEPGKADILTLSLRNITGK